MQNVVLRFDMRTSSQSPESNGERYQACLDMACWADDKKVDVIGFSEHHNSPDGFLSSPLMMAMAVASRTTRVLINVSALLIPLHDPLRLAEDIAVLDLVSNGRFMAAAGLGYRQTEYLALGSNWEKRGKVFDEKLEVILKAWTGKPFLHNGTTVQLNPVPKRTPAQLLTIAGNSIPAAKRAARFKLMFSPAIDDNNLADVYYDECRKNYFNKGWVIFPGYPSTTLLAEDPERAWKEVGEYFLFDALAYGAWKHKNRRAYAESSAQNLDELRQEGKYRIITPEQALHAYKKGESLHLAPLCGGLPLEYGWRCLELFAEKIQPHI